MDKKKLKQLQTVEKQALIRALYDLASFQKEHQKEKQSLIDEAISLLHIETDKDSLHHINPVEVFLQMKDYRMKLLFTKYLYHMDDLDKNIDAQEEKTQYLVHLLSALDS